MLTRVSKPSESLDGLLDGRLGLGAVGDVGFHDQGGAACLVDLGGEGFQPVPAAGHQRDGGAVLGELAGGGGADPAAGAGDEGDGAGQFRCHGVVSSSLDVRRRAGGGASPHGCLPGSVDGLGVQASSWARLLDSSR